MLMYPPRCYRRRSDCQPFHAIEGMDNPSDEAMEAIMEGDADPQTFVCVGCVTDSERAMPRDAYRVCWKNDHVDEIGEYDEQDLTHLMACISQALAIVAAQRISGGMIEVPTLAHLEEEAQP